MTANTNEEIAEIFVDFLNALESACVNAKRQIEEIKGVTEKKTPATVNEAIFSILKFEPQQGAKLGVYEVAYKQNCIAEKFQYAFEVLSKANATIQSRYRGDGYLNSYWIYGEGKIYRQKLKAGAHPR